MIRRLPLLLLLTLFGCHSASTPTVEELVPKITQALGGADRIRAVKTERITGKISFGPKDSRDLVVEFKRPDKMLQKITSGDKVVIRGYDGQRGWQINSFSGSDAPQWLSPQDTKYMAEAAETDGPVIDYKEKGNKVELVGKQPVNGSDAYKLEVTLKNGDVHYLYYDCKTYLKVKWEATRQDQGKDLALESYFSDYREVDGLKYAFLIKSATTKGTESGQEITTQKVELNVPLDDKEFEFPTPTAHSAPAPSH